MTGDLIGKGITRRFFSRPLLVIGAGRSGTSVLLRALGKHRAVLSARAEAPIVGRVGRFLHDYTLTENTRYRLDSLQVTRDYFYRMLRRLCFESALGRRFGLKGLLAAAAQGDFSPFQTRYWCVKTFPQREGFEGLLQLYPSLKAIYIVRDGIDNVHSRTHHSGFSDESFASHCRVWTHHVRKYRYLLDREERVCVVRHKALVERPRQLFRRIASFCALAPDSRCVDFVESTAIHPLDEKTKEGADVKEMFEQRTPAHEKWTPAQRKIFKKLCGNAMEELEYEVPF